MQNFIILYVYNPLTHYKHLQQTPITLGTSSMAYNIFLLSFCMDSSF